MYLAGDIGGTKTILALFEGTSDAPRLVRDASFPSQGYATFEQVLAEFFGDGQIPMLDAACFGVAGAIVEGRTHTTNLLWELEESALGKLLNTRKVKLLNDLEASAYGMLQLRPDELAPLNPEAKPRRVGNAAVIAAGTGLGEAILYWDGTQFHAIPSEGGHGDFGPRSDLEIELFQYLRGEFKGHVSYERILSGPGLHNVYEFLRDSGHAPESAEVADLMKRSDPNATISQLGVNGQDPLCTMAVDLFCAVYGAEAGNLALRAVAIGGVYVAGGIAPKMLSAFRRGGFMKSFTEKGRFTKFLKELEVDVALNPRAPLFGAAHYAMRL